MKPFIGSKIVLAEPMSEHAWRRSRGATPSDTEPDREGYRVLYADGYNSWSPKEAFDIAYREINELESALATGVDTPSLNTVEIAKVAHEVNRAYCQAMGDDSLSSWDDAPQWQKGSIVDGVIFHITHPAAGPEASHENWLKKKLEEGWIYGPEKDPERKQHPCMLPFHELPEEQRAKDFMFRAIVRTILSVRKRSIKLKWR